MENILFGITSTEYAKGVETDLVCVEKRAFLVCEPAMAVYYGGVFLLLHSELVAKEIHIENILFNITSKVRAQ
jgi:hypothetical protein